MKPNHLNTPPSDFDAELENDPVWNLLNNAEAINPSPSFVQDTLRRVRLEVAEQKSPWWRALFAPKPLMGVAGAALAAIAIVISLPSSPAPSDEKIVDKPEVTDDFDQLEDTFATELLSGAAEDPTLLSDEEIVALLY